MQGLWGPGSAFADFQAFLDSMKRRGVSFLEMLAMEMKSEGYYVARGLSFKCENLLALSAGNPARAFGVFAGKPGS